MAGMLDFNLDVKVGAFTKTFSAFGRGQPRNENQARVRDHAQRHEGQQKMIDDVMARLEQLKMKENSRRSTSPRARRGGDRDT